MKKTITIVLVLALIIGLIPGIARAKLVACVGDSGTYGFGLPDRESNCYPAQLEEILRQSDPVWETQNFGVSGATLLRNTNKPYVTQSAYNRALESEPDVVIIQLGSNDVKRATSSEIEQHFIPDYLALIDAFAELPSQPRIFVCIPPPLYPNNFGYSNSKLTDQIIPRIEQLPTYRDVEIIDLYTLLKDSAHLFPDGLHPNVEATTMWAERVAQAILTYRFLPDFNGDGKIDIEDLIILIEHWGQNEPTLDIAPAPSGDRTVDRADLEILMTYWGREINDPTLIAHWALDEAEGMVVTDSAGDNNAYVLGDAAWQADGGQVDGTLLLDGVDDFISAPAILNPADGPFSIFVWVYGGAPGQAIISETGGPHWLSLDLSAGHLTTELTTAGRNAAPLLSQTTIDDGNWHRIGLVWDGSHRALYVDDSVVAEDAQNNLHSPGNGLCIGCGDPMQPSTFFSGLIDDVRIYNRAIRP